MQGGCKMSKKSRSNNWTNDEDLTLAEIALRHIRHGIRMADGWEEAERKLGRTASACKFRWNGVLSKIYDSSIEQAKLFRSLRMGEKNNSQGETEVTPEIVIPKNKPINTVVANAMNKAMEETKGKPSAQFEFISSDAHRQTKKETTSQNVNKENNVDAKSENPFARIRRFASKMEKEFEKQLSMESELNEEVAELKEAVDSHKKTIVSLQKQLEEKNQLLKEKDQTIESYSEIKDLIKQFNTINS